MLEMDAEYEGNVEVHGMSFFVFVVKNCNSTLGVLNLSFILLAVTGNRRGLFS